MGYKDYIKAHLRMGMFKGHLNPICQVPVPMHKEKSDERSGSCDLGLRDSDFFTYDKVIKKLRGIQRYTVTIQAEYTTGYTVAWTFYSVSLFINTAV